MSTSQLPRIPAWQRATTVAMLLGMAVSVAVAGPQLEDARIVRWSVDGGAGHSSGGDLELRGVIGQPDVDPLQPSSGGVFELTGGVLGPSPPREPLGEAVFASGFESP